MKVIYTLMDDNSRDMRATLEDGILKVTMEFFVDKGLTIEEVCEIIGWKVIEKQEIEPPKVIKLERKD